MPDDDIVEVATRILNDLRRRTDGDIGVSIAALALGLCALCRTGPKRLTLNDLKELMTCAYHDLERMQQDSDYKAGLKQ